MTNKIRIFFLLIILLIISSGCSKELKEVQVEKDDEKDYVEPTVMDEDAVINIGLYLNSNNERNLISSYDSSLEIYTDIVSLEVYLTNESKLEGSSQKELWNLYYQNYEEIDNYKIGYEIILAFSNREVSKTILSPSDTDEIFDYVQVYLYDDINQESTWYSHITEDEVTASTIYSSIKLTASAKIEEITSIILKVFIYNDDEINENGKYTGENSYQIMINRM